VQAGGGEPVPRRPAAAKLAARRQRLIAQAVPFLQQQHPLGIERPQRHPRAGGERMARRQRGQERIAQHRQRRGAVAVAG
jgi:hypothetical protein